MLISGFIIWFCICTYCKMIITVSLVNLNTCRFLTFPFSSIYCWCIVIRLVFCILPFWPGILLNSLILEAFWRFLGMPMYMIILSEINIDFCSDCSLTILAILVPLGLSVQCWIEMGRVDLLALLQTLGWKRLVFCHEVLS